MHLQGLDTCMFVDVFTKFKRMAVFFLSFYYQISKPKIVCWRIVCLHDGLLCMSALVSCYMQSYKLMDLEYHRMCMYTNWKCVTDSSSICNSAAGMSDGPCECSDKA